MKMTVKQYESLLGSVVENKYTHKRYIVMDDDSTESKYTSEEELKKDLKYMILKVFYLVPEDWFYDKDVVIKSWDDGKINWRCAFVPAITRSISKYDELTVADDEEIIEDYNLVEKNKYKGWVNYCLSFDNDERLFKQKINRKYDVVVGRVLENINGEKFVIVGDDTDTNLEGDVFLSDELIVYPYWLFQRYRDFCDNETHRVSLDKDEFGTAHVFKDIDDYDDTSLTGEWVNVALVKEYVMSLRNKNKDKD